MVALFNDNVIDFPQKRKSNEWYTPARYVGAAREVMGEIDLDPASCEMANRTVKATRYYTEEDNGLNQEWRASALFLNPPYGKINPRTGFLGSWQRLFVKKLLAEYHGGNVKQAILLLLGNSCFNSYFSPLWVHLVCFVDGTLFFARPDGSEGHYGFGTIFVYLGPNESKFIDVFSQFGTVAKRVSSPRHEPAQPTLWEVQ